MKERVYTNVENKATNQKIHKYISWMAMRILALWFMTIHNQLNALNMDQWNVI